MGDVATATIKKAKRTTPRPSFRQISSDQGHAIMSENFLPQKNVSTQKATGRQLVGPAPVGRTISLRRESGEQGHRRSGTPSSIVLVLVLSNAVLVLDTLLCVLDLVNPWSRRNCPASPALGKSSAN